MPNHLHLSPLHHHRHPSPSPACPCLHFMVVLGIATTTQPLMGTDGSVTRFFELACNNVFIHSSGARDPPTPPAPAAAAGRGPSLTITTAVTETGWPSPSQRPGRCSHGAPGLSTFNYRSTVESSLVKVKLNQYRRRSLGPYNPIKTLCDRRHGPGRALLAVRRAGPAAAAQCGEFDCHDHPPSRTEEDPRASSS